MKILFYTMNWYPLEGSATHIFAAVLKHLKQQGHEITILTSIPYFMNSRQETWETFRRRFFIRESWEGIEVVRVFVFSPRFMKNTGLLLRAVNFLTFSINSLPALLFIGKCDVVLTVSHPPLLAGVNTFLIRLMKKCPAIYCLEDIYPDILVDLRIIKKGWFLKLLKKVEKTIYKKAQKICVLSEQMKENLLNKGIDAGRIEIIPHFADHEDDAIPEANETPAGFDLDSAFVVLLPGSLSYRCGLHNILEAAKILKDNEQIRFVFIDRGELRTECREIVNRNGLANVRFLPFLPADEFACLLASASVCLVSLEKGFGVYSVPSKLYRAMVCRRAVIAITDRTSEAARIVRDAQCGMVVEPDKPEALSMVIKELAADLPRCHRLGQNGERYVRMHFDKDTVCEIYEELICGLVNDAKD